jgi:hypothetical protein
MDNTGHAGGVKSVYIYLILIILAGTLGVSIYTLTEVRALKTVIIPETVSIEEFLQKLTSHDDLKNYKDIPPLNIMRIDSTNLGNLQAQINGLDATHIGKYIVQYTDRLVIFDFEGNNIIGNLAAQTQPEAQLPQDFFDKLAVHPELQGAETVNPSGGILDQSSLDTLKQRFPDVYKDANVGDYILRYPDRLILYNYQNDQIVGAFALQQEEGQTPAQ